MEMSPFFFMLFSVVAIACSLLMVLKKNPVASALNLVMVFFCFAGIYALLGAHLIAALQILVYTGAVMVLFVFVIMLLNQDVPSFDLAQSHAAVKAVTVTGGVVVLGMLVWVFRTTVWGPPTGGHTQAMIERAGGNTSAISQLMFSEYILPFELTSVLLLAAIIAVVAIAMRKDKLERLSGKGNHT